MKDIVTPVPQEEVKTVIRKCLEQAALVNYQRLSEYAKLEGRLLLLCVSTVAAKSVWIFCLNTVWQEQLLTCWVSWSNCEGFLSREDVWDAELRGFLNSVRQSLQNVVASFSKWQMVCYSVKIVTMLSKFDQARIWVSKDGTIFLYKVCRQYCLPTFAKTYWN